MFDQSQSYESYPCGSQAGHDSDHETRRELSLDELLADPMMPVLWHAHGISEGDVRRTIADVAARRHDNGLWHRHNQSQHT
ncbi:hypothetical protein ACFPL7_04155 [Dongia soli]|uniref:DUF3606 domain-containing protein n=1 Tax=Dongia soli TaxID=600628 RepID=A0ABU5EDT2_9PROT|nr:hypothetical protein [Dongia soli]MDY0884515.1 hypothetical protein [Dongia soli]